MPKGFLLVLVGLGIANVALYSYLFSFLQEPELGVHFLSVGQGDAELIRGNRATILIDAGRGQRVIEQIDKVLPVFNRTIDIAMVTHPNIDHYQGMAAVLERYQVRLFMMTGVESTTGEYQQFKKALHDSRVPVLYAMAGEKIDFGPNTLSVSWPERVLKGVPIPDKDLNDTSIVARLENPTLTALFTGDIDSKAEEKLKVGESSVLKVPHHGSKFASSKEFLGKVSPKWAVIEVGRNSYGHPTQETLSRLAAIGAKIFRTDVNGTISFLVVNGVVKIKTSE